jgi:hypothetical protein
VRGTKFDVRTSAGGDILVTCGEGRVSCEDSGGNVLFAEPGRAVECTAEGTFRDIFLKTDDISAFQESWDMDKLEVFKVNANRAIAHFAGRNKSLKIQFDAAYLNLLSKKSVLDKWYGEDARGQTGSTIDSMREKTALIGPLMNVKRVSFLLEPVLYRLLELQELHRQGYGRGPLGDSTTTQFFQDFSDDAVTLQERMATIRYILKLYALRNEGSALVDDIF